MREKSITDKYEIEYKVVRLVLLLWHVWWLFLSEGVYCMPMSSGIRVVSAITFSKFLYMSEKENKTKLSFSFFLITHYLTEKGNTCKLKNLNRLSLKYFSHDIIHAFLPCAHLWWERRVKWCQLFICLSVCLQLYAFKNWKSVRFQILAHDLVLFDGVQSQISSKSDHRKGCLLLGLDFENSCDSAIYATVHYIQSPL